MSLCKRARNCLSGTVPLLFIVLAAQLLLSDSLRGSNEKINSYVRKSCEQKIFSGELRVVQAGIPVLDLRCSDGKISKNTGLQFKIGSITKVFTAALMLKLESLSYLSIDDPVKNYLSDFDYEDITIRDILMHRSGLIALDDILNLELLLDEPPKVISDIIISSDQRGIYRYSNYGYQLIGKLVQVVTEREFADAVGYYLGIELRKTGIGVREGLKGMVNTPLGLLSARTALPMLKEYNWRTGADGALHSTLDDLEKLFSSLKSDSTYSSMWEFSGRRTYSIGFSKRYIEGFGQYVFGHNGAISPGGFTSYAYESQEGDRILLLSNLNYNAQLDLFYNNLWNLLNNHSIRKYDGYFPDVNLGSIIVMAGASRPDIWLPAILTLLNLLYLGKYIKAKDSLARRSYELVCLTIFISTLFNTIMSYIALAFFLSSSGLLWIRGLVPTDIERFRTSEKMMYCFSFLTATPILIMALVVLIGRF